MKHGRADIRVPKRTRDARRAIGTGAENAITALRANIKLGFERRLRRFGKCSGRVRCHDLDVACSHSRNAHREHSRVSGSQEANQPSARNSRINNVTEDAIQSAGANGSDITKRSGREWSSTPETTIAHGIAVTRNRGLSRKENVRRMYSTESSKEHTHTNERNKQVTRDSDNCNVV